METGKDYAFLVFAIQIISVSKTDLFYISYTSHECITHLLEKLFSVSQNDNYNLRSNQIKLNLPKPKTNFLKRSFSYRAAKSWNELPSETTENYNNLSILSFKRQLLNSSVSIHCK